MTRDTCILEMNRLGSENIPFCFLIDFEEITPRMENGVPVQGHLFTFAR